MFTTTNTVPCDLFDCINRDCNQCCSLEIRIHNFDFAYRRGENTKSSDTDCCSITYIGLEYWSILVLSESNS